MYSNLSPILENTIEESSAIKSTKVPVTDLGRNLWYDELVMLSNKGNISIINQYMFKSRLVNGHRTYQR